MTDIHFIVTDSFHKGTKIQLERNRMPLFLKSGSVRVGVVTKGMRPESQAGALQVIPRSQKYALNKTQVKHWGQEKKVKMIKSKGSFGLI